MTWRRWNFKDAKSDAREYALADLPILPGLPTEQCVICLANLDLLVTANGVDLPRVMRRDSKAVHIAAPNQTKRVRRTRCGRYYFMENANA